MAESGIVGGRVEMSIVAGAPVPSLLVSVAGSTLTSNVTRLGDFVIANVPAGALELRFTGDGVAAVLPIGTLAAGETITLSVRLTPADAAVDSIARVRGTDALIEGRIEEPGIALPPNTFIVGGRTIVVPDGTPSRDANGSSTAALKPGMRVRVTGTLGAAGVTARELTIL